MHKVIIVHGTAGHPNENWFPGLKQELEKLGLQVYIPQFPTPENQSLESWLTVFKKYKSLLDQDTIVVGHSLGPAFLLTVIEQLDRPIKGAFLWPGLLKC